MPQRAPLANGPWLPAAGALLLAACTCAGKPGGNPTPATSEPQAGAKSAAAELPPRAAAPVADPPPPAANTADGGSAGRGPVAARADAGVHSKAAPLVPPGDDPLKAFHRRHESECDRFVQSLGARGAKKETFEGSGMKNIASQSRMLGQYLTCRAIELDDVTRCDPVEPADVREECRERFDRFRALKREGGKDWLFTETEYKTCKTLPMADACDAFRAVAQSGDVGRCPKGDYEGFCNALFSLDRSKCHATGPHAKAVEKICQQRIDAKEAARDGLRGIASKGTLIDQAFARAATGEPDPCADFALALGAACAKNLDNSDRPPPAKVDP